MKTVKFRVWIKSEKIMTKPFYLTDFFGDGDAGAYVTNKMILAERLGGLEYEIMQFTGLLDKNGKEIYEGDIVRRENEIGVVTWWQLGCSYKFGRFTITANSLACESLEVMGNICENSELLEGKND